MQRMQACESARKCVSKKCFSNQYSSRAVRQASARVLRALVSSSRLSPRRESFLNLAGFHMRMRKGGTRSTSSGVVYLRYCSFTRRNLKISTCETTLFVRSIRHDDILRSLTQLSSDGLQFQRLLLWNMDLVLFEASPNLLAFP